MKMSTTTKSQATRESPWLFAFALLVLVGLVAWILQLSQGLDTLGINQAVVWGIYIAAFFLLAGLGSGLLILAALGDLGVLKDLQDKRQPLLLAAIASYIAAGIAILMDIGKPERVLNILFSPNFKSMFVWDFYMLALSVVVAALYWYLGAKGKLLPILALLFASAVVIVEGWILSVTAGAPLWQDPLLPVVFFIDGLIVATAVVLFVKPQLHSVKGILVVALPAVIVLSVIELVTVSYGGNPEAQQALALMWTGSLAPLYWGALLVGMFIPFALLVWGGPSPASLKTASVLAILGVFAAKIAILVAGQALPFLRAPQRYMPTGIEFGGVVGVLALAGLLFLLAQRFVPLQAKA
jgi:molybdopterin-containing oxidoreductase family membrane subunit